MKLCKICWYTFRMFDADDVAFIFGQHVLMGRGRKEYQPIRGLTKDVGAGLLGSCWFKRIGAINVKTMDAATQSSLFVEQKWQTLHEQVDFGKVTGEWVEVKAQKGFRQNLQRVVCTHFA